jgi:hypothetical protein
VHSSGTGIKTYKPKQNNTNKKVRENNKMRRRRRRRRRIKCEQGTYLS